MKPTTEGSEQPKVDKRTKEYKQQLEEPSKMGELLVGGLKVSRVVFDGTVLSYGKDLGGSPESALFSDTPKAQKRANMWLVPGGLLIVEQNGRYKAVKSWTELDLL